MRRPCFPRDPAITSPAAWSRALLLLAMVSACGARPESATNNGPPSEAAASDVATKTAPAKAEPSDEATAHADTKVEAPPVEPEPAAAVDPLAPLPDEVRERFANLPRDPKPDALIRNSHYWISNELNQQIWHEHLAKLGGAYLGVGTDQNYLLAGWAQSDLIVVVDFDASIADLHQAYGLFFGEAETYEDFFQRWSPEREAEGVALINERFSDRPDLDKISRAYKIARPLVWARFRKVRKSYEALGIPTFVTDQAQYDHIRTLWRNGRVFALRGDFTASDTMVAIGKAMHDSGFAFNVIYLSNVEQYIDFTPEFRRNFIGLPVGENGVVVRTLGWGVFGFAEGEEYHYNVQPAPKFLEWLKLSRVTNLPRMLHYRTKTDVVGLSLLDGEVQVSKKPPAIAE